MTELAARLVLDTHPRVILHPSVSFAICRSNSNEYFAIAGLIICSTPMPFSLRSPLYRGDGRNTNIENDELWPTNSYVAMLVNMLMYT